jgi:hypothetical protein
MIVHFLVEIVATGSYCWSMKKLKTVGIKELKNNLSSYLREVRSGSTVLVSDRNDIVAELHEPYSRIKTAGSANPLLLDWAQSGIVSLPTLEKQPLPASCVKLPRGTSKRLLDDSRKESSE